MGPFITNLYLDTRNFLGDTYHFTAEIGASLIYPGRAPYLRPIRIGCLALGIVGTTAALAAAFFKFSNINSQSLALASLIPLSAGVTSIPIFTYLSGPFLPYIISSIIQIARGAILGR